MREFPVKVENGETTERDWVAYQNLWKMLTTKEGKRLGAGLGTQ
ncbi:MAG: hypothetical protein Q4E67_00175 [Planctomycetia bacterium]|nr:hypothetical protein [Planctomycetia bacterium]